jgi:hypothetical protein
LREHQSMNGRTQQPDKPSRSEALRRLASTALASQEPVATAAPFVVLRLPAELLDVVDAWAHGLGHAQRACRTVAYCPDGPML